MGTVGTAPVRAHFGAGTAHLRAGLCRLRPERVCSAPPCILEDDGPPAHSHEDTAASQILRAPRQTRSAETLLAKAKEVLGDLPAFPGSRAGGQALAGGRRAF